MDFSKLDTLKKQIEYILEGSEKARNSDKWLTWRVWTKFYGFNGSLTWEKFESLPDEDDIKRIRAKIQNDEKKYLPTEWSVAKKRKWNKERWELFLGYTLMDNGQYKMRV